MISVDIDACLAQASRYELQAAELPEGSPKREALLENARQLRADAERGRAPGIMRVTGRVGGAQ